MPKLENLSDYECRKVLYRLADVFKDMMAEPGEHYATVGKATRFKPASHQIERLLVRGDGTFLVRDAMGRLVYDSESGEVGMYA